MKKVLFALLLFALAFALPVTVYTLVSNNMDTREEAAEPDQTANRVGSNSSAPSINSIPITNARVGEEYSYFVKATDSDGDELTYYVREKPSWLSWYDDMAVLRGTPASTDTGEFDVEISVSDGKWLDEQKFTIEVTGGDGSSDSGNIQSTLGVNSSSDNSSAQNSNASDYFASANEETANSTSNSNSTNSTNAAQDYGLVAQSTVSDSSDNSANNSVGQVLGESDTQLPDTALSPTFIALSGGFSLLVVGLFFYLDARMNLLETFGTNRDYNDGKQVIIRTSNGNIIKKRRIQL